MIGLAVAWEAARRGLRVVLHERGRLGGGTTHVAAGMLAPTAEAAVTEPELLALNRASAALWPQWAGALGDCGHRACGTLAVARDRDEAEALDRELAVRERFALPVDRLLPAAARRLEPALARGVRLALSLPGDHAIDPRLLVPALARAARAAGAELRQGSTVDDVTALAADHVVVAAGVWSGSVGEAAPPPLRPVKGQIMRLRDPAGPGLLDRVLRMADGYVVPRGDGRYVLGATVEERGWDTSVTAGALHDLLRDAIELVPGLRELEVEETAAGLRPGTPDNRPVIGPDPRVPHVHWATGHYRHGVLLAPITARAIVDGILGEEPPLDLAPFAPGRFAPVASA